MKLYKHRYDLDLPYLLLVLTNIGSSYAGGQWAAGDEPLYYIVSPKDVVIARPRFVVFFFSFFVLWNIDFELFKS